MAEYLIQDSSLTAIADSIRKKIGSNKSLTLDDMSKAIDSIFIYGTDILSEKNLNNWVNYLGFDIDVTYEGDISNTNSCTYTGLSGHERLYLPITVKQNHEYVFSVDFCTSTGFEFGGYDNKYEEHIYVMGSEPANSSGSMNAVNNVLAQSEALDNTLSTETKRYTASFNSGSYTTVYPCLSFGYIKDFTEYKMVFKNIIFMEMMN